MKSVIYFAIRSISFSRGYSLSCNFNKSYFSFSFSLNNAVTFDILDFIAPPKHITRAEAMQIASANYARVENALAAEVERDAKIVAPWEEE